MAWLTPDVKDRCGTLYRPFGGGQKKSTSMLAQPCCLLSAPAWAGEEGCLHRCLSYRLDIQNNKERDPGSAPCAPTLAGVMSPT